MRRILYLLAAFSVLWIQQAQGGTMADYCSSPPTINTSVKPDVFVLQDYSGSMAWSAYLNTGGSSTTNYVATTDYYGYFESNSYYTYTTNNRFEINSTCTDTNRIGTSPNCISGNLLNWVISTRVDVARKVLTGGRTRTGTTDTLQSEGDTYTYTDTTLKCAFTTSMSGGNRRIAIANSGGTCAVGTLGASNIQVLIRAGSTLRGIIQDFYDKVIFEFAVFSGSTFQGQIMSGKNAPLSSLVAAINTQSPTGNTRTGEALWEAYDYFSQSNAHTYEANSSNINKGNGDVDPWYDGTGAGSSTPVPCRKGFVLLISDGAWNGSVDPVLPAYAMNSNDLRSDISGKQTVQTYSVYAFGDQDPSTKLQGQQAMKTIAAFGGFSDRDGNNWPYTWTTYPSSSLSVTYPRTSCNPAGTWNSLCGEWDRNRTGAPTNFFEASAGDVLEANIRSALLDILQRASAGTAVSVLAPAQGSGANLLQALFYPARDFSGTTVEWTGTMQNLWYYIDPNLQSNAILEDTTADKILDLSNDYRLVFYFDPTQGKTVVRRYDSSGALVDTVNIEDINGLWEAGKLLFSRNLTTSPRTIWTNDLAGTSPLTGLMPFNTANESLLESYLQAASATEGTAIINYIHGIDQPGYRNRTVTIGGTTGVWKLGDIITSTPRLESPGALNSYNLQPPAGYTDTSYRDFLNTDVYRNRGMVFVGANDGMLHAFKLGNLSAMNGVYQKAQLTNPGGSVLGSEEWAYIPKNALPYLKYLADPNYCHLYYVDDSPLLVDASINSPTGCTGNYWDCAKKTTKDLLGNLDPTQTSWRTILVGGMGQGGSCRTSAAAPCTDCVRSPVANNGLSSYFALDVTDPSNPTLLWEFSDSALGFSTTGPAIIRVGAKDKNGRWFAVFASGPTGPIDTTSRQFMGRSDQPLTLFVVDLKTGALIRTITLDGTSGTPNIPNAFAGSVFNSTIDTDRGKPGSTGFYQDDALYVGYVAKSGSAWTDGGVIRLFTHEDTNPSNWTVSTVISGIGPVTSAVAKLQDRRNHNLWLYFGTGRYYFKTGTTYDDPTNRRAIFGIKEPCYNSSSDSVDPNCTTTVSTGSTSMLTDQSGSTPNASLLPGKDKGWFINLAIASSTYGAERDISNPLAAFNGAIFFTTFAPTSEVCALGGTTYLWGVRYDVGNAAPSSALQGEVILQTSTGEAARLKLQTALSGEGGRKSAGIAGVPATAAPGSSQPQLPIKKFLHIQEK